MFGSGLICLCLYTRKLVAHARNTFIGYVVVADEVNTFLPGKRC